MDNEPQASVPPASVPSSSPAPAAKSGPMNHDVWQWVAIIGTTTFFIISLYSMYHTIKLTKLQVAEIAKKQNAIPTA